MVVPAVRVGGAGRCRGRRGAVLSTLNGFETVVIPPSLSAVQLSGEPVVLLVNVTVLQPVVERMIDSGSVTDQLTVTLVVYQPLSPASL